MEKNTNRCSVIGVIECFRSSPIMWWGKHARGTTEGETPLWKLHRHSKCFHICSDEDRGTENSCCVVAVPESLMRKTTAAELYKQLRSYCPVLSTAKSFAQQPTVLFSAFSQSLQSVPVTGVPQSLSNLSLA